MFDYEEDLNGVYDELAHYNNKVEFLYEENIRLEDENAILRRKIEELKNGIR